MSGEREFTPPPPWRTESLGRKLASFVNDERGLEVSFRAVRNGSRTSRNREPSYYVVRLRHNRFAHRGDRTQKLSAKVDTREEALSTAREFMDEFARELEEKPIEEVEAAHRATDDREAAEELITHEVAAEALADVVGYSDELLLEVLDAETNGQYDLVAHREGDAITPVAGDEDVFDTGMRLETIHGVFPLDRSGVKRILETEAPIVTVVHLGEHTVYRFIFDDASETDVVLPRGTHVTSPAFESTVASVLEERW